jgi:Flp pilus assembly protein protease CpaA
MELFNPTLWALLCACLLLLLAASINARSLLVPNRLTFAAILSGWLLALVIGAGVAIPSQGGGFLPSLAASAVGLLLLIPFYKSCGLGGGCVKMQMAFGAWVGCALGLSAAVRLTAFATVVGGLLTAVVALICWGLLRLLEGRDPSDRFLPAQVTLSIGSIGGVIAAGWIGWI